MNKKKHAANAFLYTCWGANAVPASSDEMGRDDYGYTLIGSDGDQHNFAIGYYTRQVIIPPCVPDGDYVLGFAWYGGTTSLVDGTNPQKPSKYGYYGDYWSCAFVRIEGGVKLASKCKPVFDNDMTVFSTKGCMSTVDRPGPCTYEPCEKTGRYRKPQPFKNGAPPPLTPDNFKEVDAYPRSVAINACNCLLRDNRCKDKYVSSSWGLCQSFTYIDDQSAQCRNTCCDLCSSKNAPSLCTERKIRKLCR